MQEVVRPLQIPSELPEERIEQLLNLLQDLPDRQRGLAEQAPAVAIASAIERVQDTIHIHYAVDHTRTMGNLIPSDRPDTVTLIRWAEQLCRTFIAAYPTGESAVLRHGGICGASVVVTPADDLRILDFGVADCFAQVLQPSDESWLMQVASNVAPELWSAPSRFGQHSDMFAVGVLLYELATGRHPFGAIRDDPDDCRYQILIEVPVPPKQRDSAVDEDLSAIIFKTVRQEPDKRFASFAALLEALSRCAQTLAARAAAERTTPAPPLGPLVPQVEDPVAPPPSELDEAELEEQRRQYLEEQERLREQRRLAEERHTQRRQRTRHLQAKIRRHATAIAGGLVVLALAMVLITVAMTRMNNQRRLRTRLAELRQQMGAELTVRDGLALARFLGFREPSGGLQRAIEGVSKGHPPLSLSEPRCANWTCSSGGMSMQLSSSSLALEFTLAGDGVSPQFVLKEDALRDFLVQVRDSMAKAALTPAAAELATRLQASFSQARSAAQAQAQMVELLGQTGPGDRLTVVQPLGYLAYQGRLRKIELASPTQVLGEDAIEFEATVVPLDGGQGELSGYGLRCGYRVDERSGRYQLAALHPVPAEEPGAHRHECITNTIQRIQRAFDQGDSSELSALTGTSAVDQVEALLAWTAQCRGAALAFGQVQDIDRQTAVAQAWIEYELSAPPAGEIREPLRAAPPLEFKFDADSEWGAALLNRQWPAKPPALVRQQLSSTLLDTFRRTWKERDADGYLALFEQPRREAAEVTRMFERIAEQQVGFQITARADDQSDRLLTIEVRPEPGSDYATKAFRFELQDEQLKCRDDPLWVPAGHLYTDFVQRLRRGNWAQLDPIRREFQSVRQELQVAEQQRLEQWLDAVEDARQMLEPDSETYHWGFPVRARLKAAPEMAFHLVVPPASPSNVLYVLEREVGVGDLAEHWTRADRPWETWSALIGSPPAAQAVGLTQEDALDFARELQCDIPTRREWQLAAQAIPEASAMDFYGGVWEWCSDPAENGKALIVGGCWLDHDPQMLSAGFSEPGPDSVARQAHFGTIGFRLCRRFTIPAMVLAEPGGGGPGE